MKDSRNTAETDLDKIEEATLQWKHEHPEIDPALFQAVSLITLIGMRIENEFRTFAQNELQMPPGDLRILLALRRAGPEYAKSPVQLEKSLLVTSGAIIKQLTRLESRKLIERFAHKDRKRGYLVHLTPEGAALVDRALANRLQSALPNFERAFHGLRPEQQREGILFLRRLFGKLEIGASQE